MTYGSIPYGSSAYGGTSILAVGTLDISSTPPEAEIFIDGEDTGRTTPSIISGIPAGPHTYELVLEGYYPKDGAFDIVGGETTIIVETLASLECPISLKYEEDTIVLQATPRDGTGPYYVEFLKDGDIIDLSRLTDEFGNPNASNPIDNAIENVQITRIYTLDNADIAGATEGTITFSVYIEDSCPAPLGPQFCTETCTINIGCRAPVCNFIVT